MERKGGRYVSDQASCRRFVGSIGLCAIGPSGRGDHSGERRSQRCRKLHDQQQSNSTINSSTATDLQNFSWSAIPALLSTSVSATENNGIDFITTSGSAMATWPPPTPAP